MNDSEITESQKKGAKVFYRLPKWLSISVKLLNLISTKLTTRFLWNVFTKPLDFRMQDVENKFYKEHTPIDFFSESAKKTVKIYRIKGEGPKILFIHGWSSRASKFHKIIGEFKSKNFVCASDGFFPFTDSISLLNKNGCSVVAQPSGSINDELIRSFCVKNKISLYFTKNRLFKH